MKTIKSPEVHNRKASHEYFFIQSLEVGLVLQGTEVKALRLGHANLTDAYCLIKQGELYVEKMHISEYSYGTYNNHEPKRSRKLLLKRSELRKWEAKVKEKGYTIVPKRLFFSERGFAKLEIALAQGKKTYDKRDTLQERDLKRDMDRALRDKY